MEGLLELARMPQTDILVTAVVGMIGIRPTMEGIKAGKDIALANKETLVCAGGLVMSAAKQYGVRIYIPLLVLVALMVIFKVLKLGEDIGMPLMFLISAAVGLFTGKKINVLTAVPEAIRTAAPVMGILMGVGMFIEVMTATGVRGLVVISCLRLPSTLWLLACAISIPLFGAVSSYGACSVLGVPFAYIYADRKSVV